MVLSRTDLIERLMNPKETDDEFTLASSSGFAQASWTSLPAFIQDNIREVHSKLHNIENQIWGKLVVMERNKRSAKAYLRSQTITVDGSNSEFDGTRLGLRRFESGYRDSEVELELNSVAKGVRVWIDSLGNVWIRKNCEKRIWLRTREEFIAIGSDPIKVFDLRSFKETLLRELREKTFEKTKFDQMSFIFIQLSECEERNLLRTPIWIALIHLIAVEMTRLLAEERAAQPSPPQEPVTYSEPHAHLKNRTPLPPSASCSSSSSSQASISERTTETLLSGSSGFPLNQRQPRGGVKKRLTRATDPRPSLFSKETSPWQHLQQVANGIQMPGPSLSSWNLVDLQDIARHRRPVFFMHPEGRSRPRHGAWRSETDLRC